MSVATASQYLLPYSKVGSDAGSQYCGCVSLLLFLLFAAVQVLFDIKLK